MLRKTLFLFTLACSLLLLNACNNSTTSPGDTSIAFFKALEKNDIDAVVKLIYLPEKERDDSKKEFIHSKFAVLVATANQGIQKHSGIKNISAGDIQFSDDKKTAKVQLNIEYKDGVKEETQVNTINDNGKWFVVIR